MLFKSLRSRLILVCSLLCLLLGTASLACVGKTLYVGALDNTEDKVLAELLVLLINERTGTTVKIKFYQDEKLLYQAMQETEEEKRIDIMMEDTEDAAHILHFAQNDDPDQDYALAKTRYEKELRIVWLRPLGLTDRNGKHGATVTAPLVRQDVLTNFPLLPRVLNKLSGAIDDQTFAGLLARAEDGDKPKNIAKDFLRAKKFI